MNRVAAPFIISVTVLLLTSSCSNDAEDQVAPTLPNVMATQVLPQELCESGLGVDFATYVPAAASAGVGVRQVVAPWLRSGERLEVTTNLDGSAWVAFRGSLGVRQVLTVERSPANAWVITHNLACLTQRGQDAPTCGDIVHFQGRTYERPRTRGPGVTTQIGVGRSFGSGVIPGCADVSPYAKSDGQLLGPIAPVTVYQANEVPPSRSVITSPRRRPRLYYAAE